jgi:hypothetical protein
VNILYLVYIGKPRVSAICSSDISKMDRWYKLRPKKRSVTTMEKRMRSWWRI